MISARYPLLFWLAIGWTIAIFIACSWPGNGLPTPSNNDKWEHSGVFLVFGVLWVWSGRKPAWVIVAGIAYGMLIEVWQGIMPIGRTFDWYDGLADAVGVVIGALLAAGLAWRTRSR